MNLHKLEINEKFIPIVYLPVTMVHTLFDDPARSFVVNGFDSYIRGVFVDGVPDIMFAISSDPYSPFIREFYELARVYDKLAENCTFDRYPNQYEKSAPVIKRLRKGFAKRVLDFINHN